MRRYPSCYRCHRPLRSGDRAWIVDLPTARISLDAVVTRGTQPRLLCDDCGKKA